MDDRGFPSEEFEVIGGHTFQVDTFTRNFWHQHGYVPTPYLVAERWRLPNGRWAFNGQNPPPPEQMRLYEAAYPHLRPHSAVGDPAPEDGSAQN